MEGELFDDIVVPKTILRSNLNVRLNRNYKLADWLPDLYKRVKFLPARIYVPQFDTSSFVF